MHCHPWGIYAGQSLFLLLFLDGRAQEMPGIVIVIVIDIVIVIAIAIVIVPIPGWEGTRNAR